MRYINSITSCLRTSQRVTYWPMTDWTPGLLRSPHDRIRIGPGVDNGLQNGCPFCIARDTSLPRAGDRIWLLDGPRAGQTGTVMQSPFSDSQTDFQIHLDEQPPGHGYLVDLRYNLFHSLPKPTIPNWAPPLCVVHALRIDEEIVDLANDWLLRKKPYSSKFRVFTHNIWILRFPLDEQELWDIAYAHGLPLQFRNGFMRRVKEGRTLLSYVQPRRPIKRWRVTPLKTFFPPGYRPFPY